MSSAEFFAREKSKKFFLWSALGYLIGFAVSFGFVYWAGTQDLGLCFVIALALLNGTSSAQQRVMNFGKTLVPIFHSLDSHINSLIDEKNSLQERIEELEDRFKVLDNRINELESGESR